MKIKFLLIALTSTLLLSGCAISKSNRTQEINPINPVGTSGFSAYGMERIDVLGMGSWESDKRCSAVDFFKYLTKEYPEADDMINVRMEEFTIKEGNDVSHSCKYSGIAIAYTPLDLTEGSSWAESKATPQEEAVVVEETITTTAPVCQPCACVSCGCTPCSCMNPNNQ
ncbi:MAG: hypothetical protein MJY47_00105 [Fibrobacter sp.]|nr:hypothetical protein [Fibrobacter sp.]